MQSSDMRLHLLGSEGILGSTVYMRLRRHYDIFTYGRVGGAASFHIDINKPGVALAAWVRENDVVVNCIGMLKPTIDVTSVEDAINTNSLLPHRLANFCKYSKAKLFNFSSDCVFAGKDTVGGVGYVESDTPDAVDVYGKSKSLGQPEYGMTIRTSFIGPEVRDNPRGLLQWVLSSKDIIKGYTNCYWNGVTTLQLADCIKKILDNRWYDNGLYHIYSPDKNLSKYELCTMINDVYGLGLTVEEQQATQIMNTKINGVLNRTLSSDFELCEQLDIPDILTQLKYQKEWHESRL